jgi:GT2 family glycosyltransferase
MASIPGAFVGYVRSVEVVLNEAQALLEPEPEPYLDVVVVSYRSASTLRGCVQSLTTLPGVQVIVVDNASPDDSAATVEDLPVELIRSPRNGGFSYGCNLGAARGRAPHVLFLNPDARITEQALARLVGVMREQPRAGVIAPCILDEDGQLAWSLRRFPQHRSTFAQALFAHRLLPRSAWTDELVRDSGVYSRSGTADWVSGACMLVRRAAFEQVGGFDESFFLYCEDTDLCRRLWDAGYSVHFEPTAEIRHVGGASSEAGETQAIAARSRVIYARKHMGRRGGAVEAAGVALGEGARAILKLRQAALRRSHVSAARAALSARSGPY